MRTSFLLTAPLAIALAACGGGSSGGGGGGGGPAPNTDFAGSWQFDLAVTSSSCPNNIGTRQTLQVVITDDSGTFRLREADEAPGREMVGAIDGDQLKMSRGGDTIELEVIAENQLSGLALVIDNVAICTDGHRVDGTRVIDYGPVPPGDWTFQLTESGVELETFDAAPLGQVFAAVSGADGRMHGSLLRNVWTGKLQISTGETLLFTGSFAGSRDSFTGSWSSASGRGGGLSGALVIGGTCLNLATGPWTFTLRDLAGTLQATFENGALTQTACDVRFSWSDAGGSLEMNATLAGISGAGWAPSVTVTGSTRGFDVTEGQFSTPTTYSGLFDATAYGGVPGTIVGERR